MGTEIQKLDQQTLTITSENWQKGWATLAVTANNSPAEILSLKTPHLSQLGKSPSGIPVGVIVFQAQISSIVKFMDLKWQEDQMDECGELAYQEHPWLTIAELKQFFARLKTGRYKSNKNLNPAIFLEFLSGYADEMLYERQLFYDKRKKRVILNIEHIRNPKGRRIARWMCSEVAKFNDQAMERMKALAESLSSKEQEEEQKGRQETMDQYQARMNKLALMNNTEVQELVNSGLSPDEAINQLLNLER